MLFLVMFISLLIFNQINNIVNDYYQLVKEQNKHLSEIKQFLQNGDVYDKDEK